MEVLGIGPLEFLFIFIIILLVLGPKDIEKTARNLGKGLNKVYRSPNYQVIRKASEEIRNLPARLAAEAQLEELKEMADFKDIEQELKDTVSTVNTAAADPLKAWVEETKKADTEALAPAGTKPPTPAANGPTAAEPATPPPPAPENSIAPPFPGPVVASKTKAAPPPAKDLGQSGTSVPADSAAAAPTAPSTSEGPKS